MNMPGLATAYAFLGGGAGPEVAAAAGVARVAGASRRAHELEPMTERLARVRACMSLRDAAPGWGACWCGSAAWGGVDSQV